MDALINLLILYIIFTLFSSLFRKTTSSKKPPKQQKPSTQPQTPIQDIQTKIEQYTRKIEQYLTQTTSSGQHPPSSMSAEEHAAVLPLHKAEPSAELILPSSSDQELEELLSVPADERGQDFLPRPYSQTRISMAETTEQAESVLNLFTKRQRVLQGIILSEILGPPLSRRSQR
ncbi:MAG: hypothetical protein RBT80_01700 [Candidatus Vecturithrix sp.]|jgi:hypothetical protein|nr:hypothetical protein [Candidatus Vecturithrix sp.]